MATTRYFFEASQEHFPPEDLLAQAVAAEQLGFDGLATSDHLQPWWEGGESGHGAIRVYGEQLPALRGARVAYVRANVNGGWVGVGSEPPRGDECHLDHPYGG